MAKCVGRLDLLELVVLRLLVRVGVKVHGVGRHAPLRVPRVGPGAVEALTVELHLLACVATPQPQTDWLQVAPDVPEG